MDSSQQQASNNDNDNITSDDMIIVPNDDNDNVERRSNLVHSVSIIVEPAINIDDFNDDDNENLDEEVITNESDSLINDDDEHVHLATRSSLRYNERRKTIAAPISVFEDLYYDQPKKAKEYDDIVQSLITTARLRKEEFARLLEEHDQIVKEIRKAETNLI